MRFFILFGIPIMVVMVIAIFASYFWMEKNKPGTGKAFDNLKAIGTGADAIRALDQILTDPTLIASSEWENNARAVVREWYGRGPKRIGP